MPPVMVFAKVLGNEGGIIPVATPLLKRGSLCHHVQTLGDPVENSGSPSGKRWVKQGSTSAK